MKKLLFILSLVLFISCSSDGDNADDIVGYWEFDHASPIEVVTNSESNTKKVRDYIRKDDHFQDWDFNKDGTARSVDSDPWGGGNNLFKYSINGGILTFVWDGDESVISTYRFKLSGNTLSIFEDMASEYNHDFPDAGITKAEVSLNYVRR